MLPRKAEGFPLQPTRFETFEDEAGNLVEVPVFSMGQNIPETIIPEGIVDASYTGEPIRGEQEIRH